MTEVDWTRNCLTRGIHHGREGTVWSIPLGYAIEIFRVDTLRELIIARIYSDAMQYVEHSSTTQEWADTVKKNAEELYDPTFRAKIEEIRTYYKSPGWERDQQELVRYVRENMLNVHYEPLHGHDTVNLLCRIIGVQAKHLAIVEPKREA